MNRKHNLGASARSPQMVRKEKWFLACRKYLAYLLMVALLSAGLVLLQHYCMMHQDGDFISSYCLTDTHMRTVLAAILTLMGLALTAAVSSTVEAYRTTRLVAGINEGVYIAMGSRSLQYHLRALLTAWAPVMMIIILATNAPQSLQTLVNLGIKSAGVYVRNRSTAEVYDAYSYYNATVTQTDFANLDTAISMLTKMRDYRTSATSRLVNNGRGVVTSIVRDGYVGISVVRHSDTTNAIKRLETVISISSSCTQSAYLGPLSTVLPFNPASVNVTLIASSENFAVASVYTLLYEVMPDNSIFFKSTLSGPLCRPAFNADCSVLGPETVVGGSTTTCFSTIVAQDQIMIYTISADSVTPVQTVSNITTVNLPDLANLMVNYADSIESTPEAQDNPDYSGSVLDLYSTYPSGSLNVSEANILHTKLCASASLALSLLWNNYGINDSNVAAGLDGRIGNAFLLHDAETPLYNIVQLTYISTANVATIAGVITGCALVASLLGIAFALSSPINIKPASDSSLLYNADRALIDRKQALQSCLSNAPGKQRDLEFSATSMLYCRDNSVTYLNDTYHRLDVSHNPAPVAGIPSKSQLYC